MTEQQRRDVEDTQIIARFKTDRQYSSSQDQVIAITPIDGGVYFIDPVRHMEEFLPGVEFNRHAVLDAYDRGAYCFCPPSLRGNPTGMTLLRRRLEDYALAPRPTQPLCHIRRASKGQFRIELQYIVGDQETCVAEVCVENDRWLVDTIESYSPCRGYARAILEYIMRETGKPAIPVGVLSTAWQFWVRMYAEGLSELPNKPKPDDDE